MNPFTTRQWALLSLAVLLACGANAAETPINLEPINLPPLAAHRPLLLSDLPDFKAECEARVTKTGKVHHNGLLATVNCLNFKKREPSVKPELMEILPRNSNFKESVPITLLRQNQRAPLAVVLLGFEGPSNDKLSKAWQTYLYDAGCHVLVFDSLVRNNMNEASNHGVAGNFVEEARVAAVIIEGALSTQLADGTVLRQSTSSVRLLGTSYGGLLTAQILRMPQAKTWPVDRALLLSTPINMETTSKRLDWFDRHDTPFFTKFALARLLGGFTPHVDDPSPEEERLMRAGLGFVFHGELDLLAKSNIDRYDPTLPDRLDAIEAEPANKELYEGMLATLRDRHKREMKELEGRKNSMDKDDFKQAKDDLEETQKIQESVARRQPSDVTKWNFYDYNYLLMRPYWKSKATHSTEITLDQLLKGAPNFVQAFIAVDDPLNDPHELKAVRERIPEPLLQVLPHGGHLGYVGTKWVETLILRTFSPSPHDQKKE